MQQVNRKFIIKINFLYRCINLVMGFTRIWFSGFDIASVHTQSDVLDGAVSLVMIALFVGLGQF